MPGFQPFIEGACGHISGYLNSFGDDELKNLSKKDLESLVTVLKDITEELGSQAKLEEIETLRLGVALRWLKSSNLERRIAGINEIKVQQQKIEKEKETALSCLTSSYFLHILGFFE